jgi:hypothetical protein
MFFRDFRLEQIADNARRFMLPLDAGRHHLVIGRPHAEELEFRHKIKKLRAFHQAVLLNWS